MDPSAGLRVIGPATMSPAPKVANKASTTMLVFISYLQRCLTEQIEHCGPMVSAAVGREVHRHADASRRLRPAECHRDVAQGANGQIACQARRAEHLRDRPGAAHYLNSGDGI